METFQEKVKFDGGGSKFDVPPHYDSQNSLAVLDMLIVNERYAAWILSESEGAAACRSLGLHSVGATDVGASGKSNRLYEGRASCYGMRYK